MNEKNNDCNFIFDIFFILSCGDDAVPVSAEFGPVLLKCTEDDTGKSIDDFTEDDVLEEIKNSLENGEMKSDNFHMVLTVLNNYYKLYPAKVAEISKLMLKDKSARYNKISNKSNAHNG